MTMFDGSGQSDQGPGGIILGTEKDWEQLIPIRDQVLIQPYPPKHETKTGIILPESITIPTFRARVIKLSWFIVAGYKAQDVPDEARIHELDLVVCHFATAMPEDLESEKTRMLIPVGNILGIIKKEPRNAKRRHTESPVGSESDF